MTEKLLVFLRRPVMGQVKTRLALEIGEGAALKVYLNLLEKCHRTISGVGAQVILYFDEGGKDSPDWTAKFTQKIQSGNNLGERMMRAISNELNEDENCKVVLTGSDCPELTENHILSAYRLLQLKDLVIGPATDGGFYLIGMKCAHARLFDGISWSTSLVLERLLDNAGKLNLSFGLLPELTDIDTKEDLDKFQLNSRRTTITSTDVTKG